MANFPSSPRLLKGGIVVINPDTSIVQKVIALQYNPDTLTRTLQVQAMGDGGDRSEALRLKGPPVETYKLDAEIDAADLMERGDSSVGDVGIQPQLAALEVLVYPPSAALLANDRELGSGTLEVAALEAPLTVFVWGKTRVAPVRLTEFTITEEAFDPNLNPIRAKISLGMRVLSVSDVGFQHKAGQIYLAYQQEKERLADLFTGTTLGTLGINRIP
jgi:hypothetical protein